MYSIEKALRKNAFFGVLKKLLLFHKKSIKKFNKFKFMLILFHQESFFVQIIFWS